MRALRVRAALGLGALVFFCGCQSTLAPARSVITLASADLPAPITIAVPVSGNSAEGLTVNDWGGEIPQSKPVGGIDEDGLADLR